MSGTRQHYLPRLLLRRFVGRKEQVRIAPKDGRSFVASINNIGLENNFNGPPGKGSADDRLTREENDVMRMLDELCRSNGPVDPDLAAGAMAHFSARTKALRGVMLDLGQQVVAKVQAEFIDEHEDGEALVTWVQAHPEEVTSVLDAEVRKARGPIGLAAYRVSALRVQHFSLAMDHITAFARSPAGIDDVRVRANDLVQYMRQRMHIQVREAHISMALRSPTPPKWRERLRALVFEVQSFPAGLLLGDAIGWCGRSAEDGFPVMRFDDDIPLAVMPISSNLALIGGRGSAPTFSAAQFNRASAAASMDYLLANPDFKDLESHVPYIGVGAQKAWAQRPSNDNET